MPFFSAEAADFLVKDYRGEAVLVGEISGHREPLAGIYSKECLSVIEELISEGNYRLGELFKCMGGHTLVMDEYKECFKNINTIEDYGCLRGS